MTPIWIVSKQIWFNCYRKEVNNKNDFSNTDILNSLILSKRFGYEYYMIHSQKHAINISAGCLIPFSSYHDDGDKDEQTAID